MTESKANGLLSRIFRWNENGREAVGVAIMEPERLQIRRYTSSGNPINLNEEKLSWILWPTGIANRHDKLEGTYGNSLESRPEVKGMCGLLRSVGNEMAFKLICGVRLGDWEIEPPEEVCFRNYVTVEEIARTSLGIPEEKAFTRPLESDSVDPDVKARVAELWKGLEPNLLSRISRCHGSRKVTVGIAIYGVGPRNGFVPPRPKWVIWPVLDEGVTSVVICSDDIYIGASSSAEESLRPDKRSEHKDVMLLESILDGCRSVATFRAMCGVRMGVWELSAPEEVIVRSDMECLARSLIPGLPPYECLVRRPQ